MKSGLILIAAVASIIPAGSFGQGTTASQSRLTREGADRRPNIIYIYADDLGYGEIGAYGQDKIHTPSLDKMAAEGMKFTHHYTGAPLCSPARCTLLTGLHSGHSTVRFNYEFGEYSDDTERGQMPLPPHTQTIGTILQDAGYKTACVGKWGLGMADTSGAPQRQGFDYFFGFLDQKQPHTYYPTHLWENDTKYPLNNEFQMVHVEKGDTAAEVDFEKFQTGDHACDHITSKALEFISTNKDDPFFLYYAPTLPHLSLQPKPEFLQPYLDDFPDDPPYFGNRYAPHRHPRAAYAAMISMLDSEVGAIIEKVKSLGLDDNTIIMFSSDNGPKEGSGVDLEFFNSTGGLRGAKHLLYEGGIRVPMIARWPGHIKPGSVTDHLSAQWDVMPTLCDLLDLPAAEPVDGISFLPTLLANGQQQEQHEYLYWELPGKGGKQALRKGLWKIVREDVNGNPDTPWQLYNLDKDPAEAYNVAQDNPETVTDLNALTEHAHWHPMVKDFEFIHPKFDLKKK